MININRKQELEQSITRLIATYQLAMQEGDRSDILTKSVVTRSIIDSGRALANHLRTREQGTDDLVQKLENYYQALHAEDWAGKSASVVTKGATKMGITAGVMVALALNLLIGLANFGAQIGFNLVRLMAYPFIIYYLWKWFNDGYEKFSTGDQNPSQAHVILSRTIDPVEQQVYSLIGGSRPARTFERIEQGSAILYGVILFVLACGILFGFLQFLSTGT